MQDPDRIAGADGLLELARAARWGLAARGALVEAGVPELDLPLAVWADEAARLYAQAAAAQWDPATAIPWDAPVEHPDEVEDAVVQMQIMTYLIENETAALLVPVRFLGKLPPQFREVMQLLAIQALSEMAPRVRADHRPCTLRGNTWRVRQPNGRSMTPRTASVDLRRRTRPCVA